jgi:hypothetical protein
MEWGAVIIPIAAAIYVYKFHERKVIWWEFLISVAVPVVFIFILKFTAEKVMTRDTEYWTGYMVSCSYEEPWNEYVHKTCTRTVGSGKNQRTQSYDCSYVKHHPAKWYAEDSNGIVIGISEDTFESIASRWGSRQFVDMHRSFHSQDGDKYVSTWNNDVRTIEVVTTTHSYENRVQASNSILNFQAVDPNKYGLFDYPKIGGDGYECPSILGECPRYASANFSLNAANAALGARKQLRMWLLVFNDQPLEAAIEQESYWKGANKNELVTCVGTKDGKVSWCYVFSWTPREDLKISIRDTVASMGEFDADKVVKTIVTEADARWERKQFADFSYISVSIGGWWLSAIYFSVILTTAICFFISVNNNVGEDAGSNSWSRNRARWYAGRR